MIILSEPSIRRLVETGVVYKFQRVRRVNRYGLVRAVSKSKQTVGRVRIEELGRVSVKELVNYVELSGYSSLEEWLKRTKITSGWLYRVTFPRRTRRKLRSAEKATICTAILFRALEEELTVKKICSLMEIGQPLARRLIAKLQRFGLVNLYPSRKKKSGMRPKALALTDRGRELVQKGHIGTYTVLLRLLQNEKTSKS